MKDGQVDVGVSRKLPTGIRERKSEEGIVKGEFLSSLFSLLSSLLIRFTSGSKTTDREVLLLK
jgi:hypothetical protein